MRPATIAHLSTHLCAGALALAFAALVSRTDYRTTGLQFVAPLAVVMLTHLAALGFGRGYGVGFSNTVYRRSLGTMAVLIAGILLGAIVAPFPAEASSDGPVQIALMILSCAVIIVIVAGSVVLFLIVLLALVRWISRLIFPKGPDDPQSRLFDLASLAVSAAITVGTSFEGVPMGYSLASTSQVSTTVTIAASPDLVWRAMETATTPAAVFPLALRLFPQPVAIATDQGSQLGALRQVAFQGREGAGMITLKVIEQTQDRSVFKVQSDTTPYAEWLSVDRLTYALQANPDGTTNLTMSLDYDRLLSPAWFFAPAMQAAGSLGMSVIAQDVKTRAEQL